MIEFNFNPFPVLGTERLLLRRITKEDAPAYFALRTDHRAMTFSTRETPANVQVILELIKTIDGWIDTNEKIAWSIEEKATGKFVGTLSFHKTDRKHHRAEIGYQMAYEHWNRGFMSEAMKAAIVYAFNEMKLHTIEARVNENNAVSIHLLEKNGFVKEGHFTEDFFHAGVYYNTCVYSLVNKS